MTLTGVPGSATFIVTSDTVSGIDIKDPVSITVSSGHVSSGLTLNSGDTMTVLAGGAALATTVNLGGSVFDRGITSGTRLNSGGIERVIEEDRNAPERP